MSSSVVAEFSVTERIVQRARALGACSAGVTSVTLLQSSPSYRQTGLSIRSGGASCVLVIALRHARSESEMDWWDGGTGGTPGNRRLMQMADQLRQWFDRELGIEARVLPYSIESGGIFLKDAAALAGLGTVGKNNLLITPEFGPRVRLRALLLHTEIESIPTTEFSPCRDCSAPCRQACPRGAFDPRANGAYIRTVCSRQMTSDVSCAERVEPWQDGRDPTTVVKYCRACEFSCLQGRGD